MNKLRHRRGPGFTLVEMALLLVVVGLLMATLLPGLVQRIQRGKSEEVRRYLTTVRDEVIGHAQLHKRLPAISEIGRTSDPWKNDLFYRVAAENGTGISLSASLCSVDETDLQVVLPEGPVPDVAFLVASPGENRNLQFDNSTTLNLYPLGREVDGYPADMNRPEPFDDLYEFVTLSYLQDLVCGNHTTSGPVAPPAGYISRWELKSGTGSAVLDSGGQGTTGTIHGAEWVEEGTDYALLFAHNEHEYVDLGTHGAYDLTEFTLTGWFKTVSSSHFGVITSKERRWSDRNWWVTVWRDGGGQGHLGGELVFRTSSGGSMGADIGSGSPLTDGQWHFFAAQTNATHARLYVDGELKASQTNPGVPDTPNTSVFIGRGKEGGNTRDFNGMIDDILIYDRMLGGDEIRDYYERARILY